MSVHVLRASEARFERDGHAFVPPFTLELLAGDRAQLVMPTMLAASVAARMTAGLVKATCGTLFIGDFDPRIQPVQAKRLVGYVPKGGWFGGNGRLPWIFSRPASNAEGARRDAVDFNAALHEVERGEARRRVSATLAALGGDDDDAFAVALALIRPVALLVVDQPAALLALRIADAVPRRTAVLETVSAAGAASVPAPLAEAAR